MKVSSVKLASWKFVLSSAFVDKLLLSKLRIWKLIGSKLRIWKLMGSKLRIWKLMGSTAPDMEAQVVRSKLLV